MNRSTRSTGRGVALAAVLSLTLLGGLPSTAAAAAKNRPGNGDKSALANLTAQTASIDEPTNESPGFSMAQVVDSIGARELWAAGYTGKGVDVAVIDTGVAPVTELATSDVVIGPDLSFEGGIAEVAGLDTYGHGTHMIGIIAGHTPGADPLHPKPTDFFGVAPDAGIVSVKVADNTGAVDVSQVIAAIDWVVQNRQANGLNIRVLNLSYNTSGTQDPTIDPLSKAVENAWEHGIVVVVSAGNEGRGMHQLANPATNQRVIAVSAASTKNGSSWSVPSWATTGDGVRNPDLVAPGVSIKSLRVPGSRIDMEYASGRVADDSRLFLGSGTSQAAAVTSGAAALLIDQYPELGPDHIKDLLNSGAKNIKLNERVQGNGLVDVAASSQRPIRALSLWVNPATGLGSLEASRGRDQVTINGSLLIGEITVTGAIWDPVAWVKASEAGTAWVQVEEWSGQSWSGNSWSGQSWSGQSWSGQSWSGQSWSGNSWSGNSWSGNSWSGNSWSGHGWV